jgi:DNA-binding IclR family transcriptional regulator
MNSLEAAMRVLKLVDQSRPVLRVGEVSRELGLQKSTVSRLLRTMSEHELIERERDGQGYVAGRRALVLADLYLSAHTLLDLVAEAVDALVDEFTFVGYVAALSGPDIVILRVKHGRYPLRLVQEVGKRLPAWLTAIGRSLVAHRPDGEISALLEAAPGAPKPSMALAEIARIRRAGIASVESAIIPGIGAIGASVSDSSGNEALGFSLSYPLSATDKHTRDLMAERVREEGRRIGTRLGDPFWTAADPTAHIIDIDPRRRPAGRRSSLRQ